MKIQTQSIHFDADQKLLDFISRKVGKLEVFFDKIIDVNVMLRLVNTGQVQDKVAEIKLSIPGQIMIAKDTSKAFESSIDTAVDSLRRQLIRHKEKMTERSRVS